MRAWHDLITSYPYIFIIDSFVFAKYNILKFYEALRPDYIMRLYVLTFGLSQTVILYICFLCKFYYWFSATSAFKSLVIAVLWLGEVLPCQTGNFDSSKQIQFSWQVFEAEQTCFIQVIHIPGFTLYLKFLKLRHKDSDLVLQLGNISQVS